jgi:hypothetical protein
LCEGGGWRIEVMYRAYLDVVCGHFDKVL